MENLNKEITGNWFDLKSVMEHPVELLDYFDFTHDEIETVTEEIYQAVENGILEYKIRTINSVSELTESLKYDAAGMNRLEEVISSLKSLIYVVLLQRLITKKAVKLKLKSENETEDNEPEVPKFTIADIGNIVKEVQDLIAKDPKLKSDKNILNILIQVGRYRTENESMKKLIKNIPKDKLENFKANYSQNINRILGSLVNSYNHFLKEKAGVPVQKYSNPLEQYDLALTSELLKKEGEELSAVKSTLGYAARERFRTREIILTVDKRMNNLKNLLNEEKKKYFNLALSEQGARELSRYLSLEIIENLKRDLENI